MQLRVVEGRWEVRSLLDINGKNLYQRVLPLRRVLLPSSLAIKSIPQRYYSRERLMSRLYNNLYRPSSSVLFSHLKSV